MIKRKISITICVISIAVLSIYSGVLVDCYKYFRDTTILTNPNGNDHHNSQHELSLLTYLRTKQYIKSVKFNPTPINTPLDGKISNIIENARIGEALGFLTENVKSQDELINTFLAGLFDINALINDLRTKNIIAPYGKYNNNYLTPDNTKLIYSDDTDLAVLTYNVLQKMKIHDLQSPSVFAGNVAKAMAKHWVEMKKSGEYGSDGLYYGKRGYSKDMLTALSMLASKQQTQQNWFSADGDVVNNRDNGSLLRSWPLGLDRRLSPSLAYDLAYKQSTITHEEKDIAISAGALAYIFNTTIANKYTSKHQVILNLISIIEKHSDASSGAAIHIKQGMRLAKEKIDPILVYNKISGERYDDFLLLISYTFLYFDNYENALIYIVHTPGDNDSVAFVTGALFTAYSNQSLPLNSDLIEIKRWEGIQLMQRIT